MCDAKSLMAFYFPPSLLGWDSGRKDKSEAKHLTREAQKQTAEAKALVPDNKLANSVQTTETNKPTTTDLVTKLKQQKVPLNTSNTGAAIGGVNSVGLNLGGY